MKRRNHRKPVWLFVALGTIVLAGFMYYYFSWRPSNDYKAAKALYNEGDYEKAAIKFLALGNFADAELMAQEAEQRFLDSMNTLTPTQDQTQIVRQTDEISDSWDDIIAAIDDGTVQERYAIGAWKPLELKGIGTIDMQLAGFDLDTRTDGKGKAATTWIAVELLPEMRRMNSFDAGLKEGWKDCELRIYLQQEVFQAIPANMRSRLLWVDKGQDVYETYNVQFIQVTSDNLWIPSLDELFGDESLYYDLFKNSNSNRIKKMKGSHSSGLWWLRTAESRRCFYYVKSDGDCDDIFEYNSVGVALGFCL